jgi:dolichol-phosphate mannosyltransferase
MSKLSIIVPVYYNADTLLDCYKDIYESVVPNIDKYELVFIDDGSGDNSWEVCKQIASKDNNVRLIKLSRNFGSHAACYSGLAMSTGDCAVIKSADCQEPPSLIVDMYNEWKRGNRVVLGARAAREEGPLFSVFSNLYYRLIRRFISKKMPKMGFDCFLLDRRAIEALKLLDERYSAIALQVLWIGFTTSTVYYTRLARKKGKSKWTLSKKVGMVVDSLVGFSPMPVRFVECMGILFAVIAIIWGCWLFVARLLGYVNIQGWTAMMITMLFSSGMIMLSLGILGEYIWRTFDVSQNRPVYIVEEEHDFTGNLENNNKESAGYQ